MSRAPSDASNARSVSSRGYRYDQGRLARRLAESIARLTGSAVNEARDEDASSPIRVLTLARAARLTAASLAQSI